MHTSCIETIEYHNKLSFHQIGCLSNEAIHTRDSGFTNPTWTMENYTTVRRIKPNYKATKTEILYFWIKVIKKYSNPSILKQFYGQVLEQTEYRNTYKIQFKLIIYCIVCLFCLPRHYSQSAGLKSQKELTIVYNKYLSTQTRKWPVLMYNGYFCVEFRSFCVLRCSFVYEILWLKAIWKRSEQRT